MKEEFGHYWICQSCARKKGGVFPEGHCCTAICGECKYCGTDNLTLIPIVDYNWPKDKKMDKQAKMNRD